MFAVPSMRVASSPRRHSSDENVGARWQVVGHAGFPRQSRSWQSVRSSPSLSMPSSHRSLDGSVVDVVAPGSVDDDVVLVVATAPVVEVVGGSVVVGAAVVVGAPVVVVGAAVVVGASVVDVVVGSSVVVGAAVVEVVVGSSVVVGCSVVDEVDVVGSAVEDVVGSAVDVVGSAVVDVVVSVVDVVVSGGICACAGRPDDPMSATQKQAIARGETRIIEPTNPSGASPNRQPVRTSRPVSGLAASCP
jgi:hypothetical protein